VKFLRPRVVAEERTDGEFDRFKRFGTHDLAAFGAHDIDEPVVALAHHGQRRVACRVSARLPLPFQRLAVVRVRRSIDQSGRALSSMLRQRSRAASSWRMPVRSCRAENTRRSIVGMRSSAISATSSMRVHAPGVRERGDSTSLWGNPTQRSTHGLSPITRAILSPSLRPRFARSVLSLSSRMARLNIVRKKAVPVADRFGREPLSHELAIDPEEIANFVGVGVLVDQATTWATPNVLRSVLSLVTSSPRTGLIQGPQHRGGAACWSSIAWSSLVAQPLAPPACGPGTKCLHLLNL